MRTVEEIRQEYEENIKQLSDPELIYDIQKNKELLQRNEYLKKIIDKDTELEEIKKQLAENKTLFKSEESPEFVSLAEEETKSLRACQENMEKEIERFLQEEEGEEKNPKAMIIEIRAGVGGEEATLFVSDLARMYERHAEDQGWQQKVLTSHPTGSGGFKEIILEIKNKEAWSQLQHEGGVHRVQRIPETEKNGRIHTSTVSVAVLAEPDKKDVKIKPDDLKIDTCRSSGPGGQNVNKRETAIRITHIPTGLVVTSQTERNQLQNKENAMSILAARLLEKNEMDQAEKLHGKRKAQIGWAKRAEKIRTYNFPQDRVTDHRIKKSWHGLDKIMDGRIEKMIEALQKASFEEN